jgi:tetratricopeptide (TPR) repeat protein
VVYGVLQFAGFWRIVSAFALALILFCLVITQTRAVWVAIAAATLLVIIFLNAFIKRHQLTPEQIVFLRRRLVQTALIAVVMVSAAGFSHSRQTATNSKVQRTFERPRSSVDERLRLWRKSLEMIKEHPVLGVGLGHWKIWLPHYGVSGMRSETGFVHFQRPHNDFIWVLAESGPLGLLAYLSIFAMAGFYVYKIWQPPAALDAKIFSLLMFFGIAGYLVIACFDFPKERIEHTILLMLMLAAVTSIYHQTHPLSNTTISTSALLSLFLFSGILSSSAIAVGWVRLNSEIHTKKALAAREAGDWPTVIAEIDRGNSPLAAMDPMATPLSWYRGTANFSLSRLDDAFADFQEAYAIHPYHIHVLNNLATCYELKGNHEQAIEHYNQALAISPRFEDALINLSVVYYYQKKYAQARQTLLLCDSTSANPKIPAYMQAITAQLAKRNSLK